MAGNGAGRANELAHGAPAAFNAGDGCDGMVFNLQAAAGTYANAKAAAVAFFFIYDRIFRHFYTPTQSYVNT